MDKTILKLQYYNVRGTYKFAKLKYIGGNIMWRDNVDLRLWVGVIIVDISIRKTMCIDQTVIWTHWSAPAMPVRIARITWSSWNKQYIVCIFTIPWYFDDTAASCAETRNVTATLSKQLGAFKRIPVIVLPYTNHYMVHW